MNTEGGFCDRIRNYSNSPLLAKEVADDVVKLHVVALAEGVKTWLWLPFTERYKERHYGPQWKGLVLPDQTGLPAFTSYKVMVQKLDGFTSAEKLNNFSSAYVYKFIVHNKPVYVAWSDKPVAVNFQPELSGEVKVTEVTMASDTTDSRDIRLTTSPIFVEK